MKVEWRGSWGYGEALAAQRAHREALIAGAAPAALWLLEHPPVITVGRRAVEVDEPRVRAAGFDFHVTERGGLATCHEPGQLVGYLLRDVSGAGVRRTVAAIEEGLIVWLASQGVEARRRCDAPGVWVGPDKIAAIGLHVRRGVTMHGFALNLVNDLRGFALITPCGIVDGGVTTLLRLRGRAPAPEAAWPSVARDLARALSSLDSPVGSE